MALRRIALDDDVVGLVGGSSKGEPQVWCEAVHSLRGLEGDGTQSVGSILIPSWKLRGMWVLSTLTASNRLVELSVMESQERAVNKLVHITLTLHSRRMVVKSFFL